MKELAATEIHKLVSNYLKYMDNVRTSSPHTLAAYHRDLSQAFSSNSLTFSPQPEHHSADDIFRHKDPLVVDWLSLARAAQTQWSHLSLATRNRKASTLKSFFKWAFLAGHLSQDLSFQIQAPRVPHSLPHYLSVDEALLVLKSFSSQNLATQTREELERLQQVEILFVLLYGSGLRVSEACALAWAKVRLEQRSLLILGKGQQERWVVLPLFAAEKLEAWQKVSTTEYVFGHQPLHRRKAYEWIRKLGHSVGLQSPLHPHALRHSFATHLLTGGVNLRVLQTLLGHESLLATQKYTHLSIDALARTLESHHPLGEKT